MNIKAYIESGVLELYIAQALTPAESREVESLAAQYPEIQEEIKRIEETINAFAMRNAIAPRATLKKEIFDQVKIPTKEQPTIRPRSGGSAWWLAAAVALVAIIAVGFLYNKWRRTDQQLQQTLLAQQQQTLECDRMRAAYEEANDRLNTLLNPNTKSVQLKGLPIAPEARVVVYYNPAQQASFLSVLNLPKPPAGKQYQLWALVNGQPVDAGVFNVGSNALQTMKSIEKAQAFAITLEKEGGSPTPTLDQMYAMGSI